MKIGLYSLWFMFAFIKTKIKSLHQSSLEITINSENEIEEQNNRFSTDLYIQSSVTGMENVTNMNNNLSSLDLDINEKSNEMVSDKIVISLLSTSDDVSLDDENDDGTLFDDENDKLFGFTSNSISDMNEDEQNSICRKFFANNESASANSEILSLQNGKQEMYESDESTEHKNDIIDKTDEKQSVDQNEIETIDDCLSADMKNASISSFEKLFDIPIINDSTENKPKPKKRKRRKSKKRRLSTKGMKLQSLKGIELSKNLSQDEDWCTICASEVADDILLCDMCNVCVHLQCYGIYETLEV